MKKILFVFGTRPEAIKMAPVIKKFQKPNPFFKTKVCVTAQHREMLDQVLSVFEIQPDYDLNIMGNNQTLFDITSKILTKISNILNEVKPDFVFVHGDTSTTFITSLACFYLQIKVVHIEAGLRTNDIYSPFPEEANRKLTSVLTALHFAPTKKAKENLIKEGYSKNNIFVTGNTVIDALFLITDKLKTEKKLKEATHNFIKRRGYIISNKKIILVTGHRRENFGQGFKDICTALSIIADKYKKDIDIVFPVHLNPNVKNIVTEQLSRYKNIYLLEPLDYLPFIYLMSKAHIVLTDSGGIQEEAPALGKPVLVMRDTTERPEAVDAGTVKLVGTSIEKIIANIHILLTDSYAYSKMSFAYNPYGDGKAANYIYNKLLDLT